MHLTTQPQGEVSNLPGFYHAYADVNHTRIHYVKGGSGPAIVLVHGWPFTWAQWRKIMPLLANAGYTVIAVDQRGMGDSDKPVSGYEKVNSAEDIYQLVNKLGFNEIDIVGTDIGTMTAYAYAVSYPKNVRRLILSESSIPGFGLEEYMDVANGGSWHFGFHMQADFAAMLVQGKEAEYLERFWKTMSPIYGLDPDLKEELLTKYRAPKAMRSGFMHYEAFLRDGQTNRERFKEPLSMPVLVVNGTRGIPQERFLHYVKKVASNVESALITDAGHTLAEDNPEEVASVLLRFLI